MGSCCVQEGKGACPLIIVRWALRNIREVQTMNFWESVQHRNGECRARGEKASCACLCYLPFSFSFPPLLCLYFLATLNNVKKKNLGEVLDDVAVGASAGSSFTGPL